MKTSFRVRFLSLVMSIVLLSSAATAAEYYVVIGAFAHESNAKRFTTTVRNFFKGVTYTYNADRQLYYVTAMKTSNKNDARNWSLYLRNEKGFEGAWVLTKLDSENETATSSVFADAGANAQVAYASDNATGFEFSPSDDQSKHAFAASAVSKSADLNAAWTTSKSVSFIPEVKDVKAFRAAHADPSANLFTFIVEDDRGNVMPSEVMLVDFANIKKLAAFQTGDNVAIKSTKPEQVVTFVCDRLGYAQETRMFNLSHISRGRDVIKNEEGVWEVRIKLKKMEVNDIAPMNKTLFYKDAAVLEPASQEELEELVTMLKSNPAYKIVLHSHCNPGGKRGLKLTSDESNYFNLDATVEKNGSDKLLTKKRAEVVENYLISRGIDKKRVSIVAWGSVEPIVSSTSKEAGVNDRMEVEIVN